MITDQALKQQRRELIHVLADGRPFFEASNRIRHIHFWCYSYGRSFSFGFRGLKSNFPFPSLPPFLSPPFLSSSLSHLSRTQTQTWKRYRINRITIRHSISLKLSIWSSIQANITCCTISTFSHLQVIVSLAHGRSYSLLGLGAN